MESMTYCVAIKLNQGLVCLSDTRTNAGLDNIARFKKMFTWQVQNDRAMTLMTSGNLSVTQSVISSLQETIDRAADTGAETILNAPSMFRVAEIVGNTMTTVQGRLGPDLAARGENSSAMILLAGQVSSGNLRLFQIYSAGNFIEATTDTPFFQIGEHKYGKPILDRTITPQTSLEDATLCALVSMDSTLRSNLSVGMPLDLSVLPINSFNFSRLERIEDDDPAFDALSAEWSASLSDAFARMREKINKQALQPTNPQSQQQIQAQQQMQQLIGDGSGKMQS